MLFFLQSCLNNRQQEKVDHGPQYRVVTCKIDNGWAYSIFINNKEYVRQLFIPAIEGKTPFPSKDQANKVGWYVVSKLKDNASPSLSKKELLTLNVLSTAEDDSTKH